MPSSHGCRPVEETATDQITVTVDRRGIACREVPFVTEFIVGLLVLSGSEGSKGSSGQARRRLRGTEPPRPALQPDLLSLGSAPP
jgi:hypothetical protein